ncbi:hypothetical protein CEUSTIGMA_g9266.t1 [Chlamydomonas eustigma]|uniref:Plastid lipid-associated protein/fibrillin conserved domain-containing protein n=1 Tax=Chlamydomonas eustigma TaxID=1157962 RepID=A0A250XFH5_9CHLO|nr:hypothetical protein CEUSTIGMA_g9266.t1 [Chlamydomonas eustigma]|eukprot:GAX81838.1 hypothetical protein CEUSTIGMA_g9266.t1 [Chlamydomonas eustigma]
MCTRESVKDGDASRAYDTGHDSILRSAAEDLMGRFQSLLGTSKSSPTSQTLSTTVETVTKNGLPDTLQNMEPRCHNATKTLLSSYQPPHQQPIYHRPAEELLDSINNLTPSAIQSNSNGSHANIWQKAMSDVQHRLTTNPSISSPPPDTAVPITIRKQSNFSSHATNSYPDKVPATTSNTTGSSSTPDQEALLSYPVHSATPELARNSTLSLQDASQKLTDTIAGLQQYASTSAAVQPTTGGVRAAVSMASDRLQDTSAAMSLNSSLYGGTTMHPMSVRTLSTQDYHADLLDLTSRLSASQQMLVIQSPSPQSFISHPHTLLTQSAGGEQIVTDNNSLADQMMEVTEGLRSTSEAIIMKQQELQGRPDVMSSALSSILQYFQGAAASSSLGTRATSVIPQAAGNYMGAASDGSTSNRLLHTKERLAEAVLQIHSTAPAPVQQQQQDMEALNLALQQALQESQRDPAEAAEKLRSFILQYKGHYSADVSSRVASTASKLQAFVDSHQSAKMLPSGSAATRMLPSGSAASVEFKMPSQDYSTLIETAQVSPIPGEAPEPLYHNYLLEGVLGTLQWVQDLIILPGRSNVPPPSQEPAVQGITSQTQQMIDASRRLQALSEQMKEAHTLYHIQDTMEKEALSSILSQLSLIAEKLAKSGAKLGARQGMEGLTVLNGNNDSPATTMMSSISRASGGGQEDPLLSLLDGLYKAVVVDSGLRDFLVGVKRLGDSIVVSMDTSWSHAPPTARLVAYVAAVAGAFFLLRARIPTLWRTLPRSKVQYPSSLVPPSGTTAYREEVAPFMSTPTSASANASASAGSPLPWLSGTAASFSPSSQDKASPSAQGLGPELLGSDSRHVAQILLAAQSRADSASVASWPEIINPLGGERNNEDAASVRSPDIRSSSPVSELAGGQGTTQKSTFKHIWQSFNGALQPGSQGDQTSLNSNSSSHKSGVQHAAYTSAASSKAQHRSMPASACSSMPAMRTLPDPAAMRPVHTSSHSSAASIGASAVAAVVYGQGAAAAAAAVEATAKASYPVQQYSAARTASMPAAAGGSMASWGSTSSATTSSAMTSSPTSAGSFGSASSNWGSSRTPHQVGSQYVPPGSNTAVNTRGNGSSNSLEVDSDKMRLELKRALHWATKGLGPVASVVPGGEPFREEMDHLVQQLEALSPSSTQEDNYDSRRVDPAGNWGSPSGMGIRTSSTLPGSSSSGSSSGSIPGDRAAGRQQRGLLGSWTLCYASNGLPEDDSMQQQQQGSNSNSNLFAQILQLSDAIPGLGMDAVVQTLEQMDPSPAVLASAVNLGPHGVAISMNNSAVFRFGPLGSWKVTVSGGWSAAGSSALVTFDTFSIKPVSFLGLETQDLPELSVPIPELLRSQSSWHTTYLDQDLRISRGANGSLFVFKRVPASSQQQSTNTAGYVYPY